MICYLNVCDDILPCIHPEKYSVTIVTNLFIQICCVSEGMAYQCLLKNELLGAGIEDLKVILMH